MINDAITRFTFRMPKTLMKIIKKYANQKVCKSKRYFNKRYNFTNIVGLDKNKSNVKKKITANIMERTVSTNRH